MKKMITAFLAVALLCACTVPAGAAGIAQAETVHAALWQNHVWIDDERVVFLNEHGANVDLISYNGTVYIPVRTAGEWMGSSVNWDQATQTVSLIGGGEPIYHGTQEQVALTPEEAAALLVERENGVDIQLCPGITVVVDGVKQSFTNVKGEAVYPIVYKSVTYLPVRNIGELCGKEVTWVPGQMEMIYLHEPLTDAQRTEIDIFYNLQLQYYTMLNVVVEALTSDQIAADDRVVGHLRNAKNYLQEMQQASKSSVPVIQTRAQHVMDAANDMEKLVDGYLSRIEKGTTLQELKSDFQFDKDMTTRLGNINGELAAYKAMLDAL